jgi:hypothetical protein
MSNVKRKFTLNYLMAADNTAFLLPLLNVPLLRSSFYNLWSYLTTFQFVPASPGGTKAL